jgi:hypothetical protein
MCEAHRFGIVCVGKHHHPAREIGPAGIVGPARANERTEDKTAYCQPHATSVHPAECTQAPVGFRERFVAACLCFNIPLASNPAMDSANPEG